MYRAAPGGGGRGAQAPAKAPATPPPATAPSGPARRFGIPVALPGLSHQTVRMIVRTSIGGHSVRVRLSNALGDATLQLGGAHIAIRDKDSDIQLRSDRPFSVSGKPSAAIYAGQVLISDPVTLDVPTRTGLAVSLYFP